jgi:predicted transcriptional regulator of viral defense system
MKKESHIANITTQQLSFIKLLDEYEINIFTLTDIEKRVNQPFKNLRGIADKLAQKGLLIRIERGKYCRHNFNDEWVISNYLVNDGVVAYWSALNRHGLTEQFPNTVFVQTTKEKKEKNIEGVRYKFIRVAKRKLTGYKMYGFGNNQYRMTDIEKTIVDCFDLPEYSGGYAELIRAFNTAELDAGQMVKYCKFINNIAATKRIAFLAEFLQKPNFDVFLKYAKKIVKERYNLFDPIGLDTGEYINKWKIRMNVSKDEISEICNKMY